MITMTHGNIRSVIRNKLTQRLSADDIHEICFYTQGERNNSHKEELYACKTVTKKCRTMPYGYSRILTRITSNGLPPDRTN